MKDISTEDLIKEMKNRGFSCYKSSEVYTVISHGEDEDSSISSLKESLGSFIEVRDARPNAWDPTSPSKKCKEARIIVVNPIII